MSHPSTTSKSSALPTEVAASTSDASHTFSNSLIAVGILAAFCAWFVAPSAAFFDSGELAATAIELGVPHPTGFPLFNLSGHLFTWLPFGSVGMRVNLAGTLFTSMAIVLLARAVGIRSRHVALDLSMLLLLGAFCLMVRVVNRHALAAEVYPLTLLHAAGCVWIAARTAGRERLVGLSLMLGLALGTHAESALIAGIFGLLALLAQLKNRKLRPADVAVAALFAVCAGAVVVYLVLAGLRPAAFSWGDVHDVESLFQHLSAASIRAAFADEMGMPSWAAAQLYARVMSVELLCLAPCAAIAVWGWPGTSRQARVGCLAALGLLGVDAIYAITINPMGLVDEQCGMISALVVGCLLLAGSAQIFARDCSTRQGWVGATVIGVGLGVLFITYGTVPYARAELRNAPLLGQSVVASLAPGGLGVVSSDHLASQCTYLQVAEGSRPDAQCAPVAFTRDRTMLKVLARRGRPGFRKAAQRLRTATSSRAMAEAMGDWLRPALQEGPVGWEAGSVAEDAQVLTHFLPGFPAGEVTATTVSQRAFDRALDASVDAAVTAFGSIEGWNRDAAQLVGRWLALQASVAQRRRFSGADRALRLAAVIAPNDRLVMNNIAVHHLAQNRPREALAVCAKAEDLHPGYAVIHRTATRAALATGDLERALRHASAYLQSGRGKRSGERWLNGLIALAEGEQKAALLKLATERRDRTMR